MCMDEPEAIIALIENYPDFKAMYEQVYEICRNIEEVMGMFSKELRELDRNTVQLMIDEMQEELNQEKRKVEQKEQQLSLEREKAEQEREKRSRRGKKQSRNWRISGRHTKKRLPGLQNLRGNPEKY